MPALNLFLFLTLALAGVLTYHLYQQDRIEDENGYGHDEPAGGTPQVIRYRRTGSTVPVQTGMRPVARGPVRFFDLTPAGLFEKKSTPVIRTDFMTSETSTPERSEDCMSSQSA